MIRAWRPRGVLTVGSRRFFELSIRHKRMRSLTRLNILTDRTDNVLRPISRTPERDHAGEIVDLIQRISRS